MGWAERGGKPTQKLGIVCPPACDKDIPVFVLQNLPERQNSLINLVRRRLAN